MSGQPLRSIQQNLSTDSVPCTIDGESCTVPAGSSVAAALWSRGPRATRRSDGRSEPRAALCGIGSCKECRVLIDGIARLGCKVVVQPGMNVVTRRDPIIPRPGVVTTPLATSGTPSSDSSTAIGLETAGPFDVLVVGAGPAGCTAALAASEALGTSGRVAMLDEHDRTGGAIWRSSISARARRLAETVRTSRVERLLDHAVVDARRDGATGFVIDLVSTEDAARPLRVRARRLILATGAVERFVPFPGWTLPGVVGVGGLQKLVDGGLDVRGRKVVLAGSGPLLLATAATVVGRGAELVGLFEQADARAIRSFATTLALRHPERLVQAARLAFTARTPLGPRCGTWPVRAEPRADDATRLGSVTVRDTRGRERRIETDLLACGFGLAPRLELAALLGCRFERDEAAHETFVVVDHACRTSVDGVFAAGECTGIGGVDVAITSGSVAGRAAAGHDTGPSTALVRARRFAGLLRRTFAPRSVLRSLADADTVVCRCEDVTAGALHLDGTGPEDAQFFDTRDAKLKTRCGMGRCQGAVCMPALEFHAGWSRDRARPPLTPVSVSTLATLARASEVR